MDPATIGLLSTLITGVVALTAAGIVACCRSQKNQADQHVNDSSTDLVKVETGGSEETTITYAENGAIASRTTKKTLPTIVTLKSDDIGTHRAGASNAINGYDHNSLEGVVSKQDSGTAGQVVGADSAAARMRPELQPPKIDTRSVIYPIAGQKSILKLGKLEITEDGGVTITGFSSEDLRTPPSLEPHVDSMGGVQEIDVDTEVR